MEQLRVHVRNLSQLNAAESGDGKGGVELYERGYGKDAAGIAKEAITYGMLHLEGSPVKALNRPPSQRKRL